MATIANLQVQTLAVSGNLTVQGLTDVQDIKVNGHIITAGTAPTGQVLSAVGTAGAVTIDGNDSAGTIIITTGSSGMAAGDLSKVSFTKAFGKAPRIILSGQDAATLDAKIFPASKTLPPSTTLTLDYFIVE